MVEAFIDSESRKSEKPQENRVNGKANGKAINLFSHPTPLTLENLELALKTRYDNVEVKESTWNKGDYTISVNIQNEQTKEQIKEFMYDMFGKAPLGGHFSYEHLFQQYKTENETFNISFNNIIPPRR